LSGLNADTLRRGRAPSEIFKMKAIIKVYFVVRESKCVMATNEKEQAENYIATFNKHCVKATREAKMVTQDIEIDVN